MPENNSIQVLLSSYNGERYIEKQIDSIFRQENADVHCLIRDDGSIDNTINIIKKVQQKYLNIQLIEGKNEGFANSFYDLVCLSDKYDYYAFADQDDLWEPDKLVSCINSIKDCEEAALGYCNGFISDENFNVYGLLFDNCFKSKNIYESLIINPAPGCSMVFNSKAKELFLKADKSKITYHDFWLYVVCSLFGKVNCVDQPKFYYIQHIDNALGSDRNMLNVYKNRINQLKKKTHCREDMAGEIIRCFSEHLTEEEIDNIKVLRDYRNSAQNRFKLFFSDKYVFESFKNNFWFRMHILFGNV